MGCISFYSKQRIRLCKVFYERDFLFDSVLIPYKKKFFVLLDTLKKCKIKLNLIIFYQFKKKCDVLILANDKSFRATF